MGPLVTDGSDCLVARLWYSGGSTRNSPAFLRQTQLHRAFYKPGIRTLSRSKNHYSNPRHAEEAAVLGYRARFPRRTCSPRRTRGQHSPSSLHGRVCYSRHSDGEGVPPSKPWRPCQGRFSCSGNAKCVLTPPLVQPHRRAGRPASFSTACSPRPRPAPGHPEHPGRSQERARCGCNKSR
jgi:hypothetical protein